MANNIRGLQGRQAKLNNKKNKKQVSSVPQVVVAPTPPKRDKKRIGQAMLLLNQMVDGEKLTGTFSVSENGEFSTGAVEKQPPPEKNDFITDKRWPMIGNYRKVNSDLL